MKSGEGPEEKLETLWEKLRRVGKRGGHTTPVASFWRRNESGISADPLTGGVDSEQAHVSGNLSESAPLRFISSRKLAAALWQLHHYKLPVDKMHHGVTIRPPRLRRLNHHRDPPPTFPDLPEISGNLRRHVAESLTQHHRSVEKSPHAIPTVSPQSYGSSMEIAPYKPAVTPSSSIELRGRSGEASYCLRTSTELLKVLNRIWSLEEKHVSNMSLIKALKKELARARSQTKELVREHQTDQHQIDELMKHIAEDKLVRNQNEQERIDVAVQSMSDELENERKLRLRLQSLHRKLALELYEAKTSLASVSKALEKERKSGDLLEGLCDEFAQGIRDYGRELHSLRQKSDKDWGERGDHDRLILRISESWLHERMKAKLQPTNYEDKLKQILVKKKLESCNRTRELSPSSLQVKFEEHMTRAISYGVNRNQVEDAEQIMIGEGKTEPNIDYRVASSMWRSYPSPVREWTEKLPPQYLDNISETSSKCPPELEENNLKAKLVEARTKSQRSCSRQKASIFTC